ncbi:hypothetical protein [Microlunatus ginsengisoli]
MAASLPSGRASRIAPEATVRVRRRTYDGYAIRPMHPPARLA